MPLNLQSRGPGIAFAILLGAIACGTASQSQPQAESRPRAGSSPQTDGTVVATIGEESITLADLDEKVLTSNLAVFQQLYDARREALGELVADALLRQEAVSRGVSREELIEEEITSKVAPVTDDEVQAFYEQNQARLGGQTLEQVGPQIREFMAGRNEATVRQAFIDELREAANVDIALDPPRVPVTVAANERVRGPESAPITIVEYSDFQ